MRKEYALVVLVLLVLPATAGCIDIYTLKNITIPPKEYKTDYRWDQKVEVSKDFYINITDKEPKEARYLESFGFNVSSGSKRIKIQVNIHMIDIVDLPPIPGLEPIIENITTYLKSVKRHVDLYLYTPDGDVFWMKTYNASVDEPIYIPSPVPGTWKLEVDAVGYGFKGYHDSLYVQVSVLEPVGVKVIS